MMAIVPDPKSKRVATTTSKCARVTEQVQLQFQMAVLPELKTKIDCNNHWQMCLSDGAISVATTTGKCAKMIEEMGNNQTKQGQCGPMEDSKLLQLGCSWSFQGSNGSLQMP